MRIGDSPVDVSMVVGRPAVNGVHGAVAPADWRKDGTALITVIPTEDGNSPDGRATLDRLRAAPTARYRSEARRRKELTSSTRSTATSRC
jgi:hypothetical protein